MEFWIEWARGPGFTFACVFMLLGLLRHLLLTVWEVLRARRRAGDKSLPYLQICVATLRWLFPVDKWKSEPLFSLTSFPVSFRQQEKIVRPRQFCSCGSPGVHCLTHLRDLIFLPPLFYQRPATHNDPMC